MLKGIGIGLILVLIVLWFNDYWRDWLHQVIKEQVERLQDRTVMDLRAPSPPNPPILCVNPKGDEARGFLRFVQRIAKIPFSFRKRYDAAWFGVGVGIGLWLTYAQMLEEADWNLSVDSLFDYLFSAILLAGVWGTLFAAGGFVLAELGRWFVPTVLKGRAYAFGKAPSYYNWFAEIVVEASPPDSFKDPRIEDFYVSGRLFGLRHSRIYKSDDALNCLAGWISGKDCRRNDS